jgi:hypothetical protein
LVQGPAQEPRFDRPHLPPMALYLGI